MDCKSCLMDDSAADFAVIGDMCNYCAPLSEREVGGCVPLPGLDDLIGKIKLDGVGKEYDCIVGISGGVDSSYVLMLAAQYNLRVLAVHMDNGWNSELAQNNIEVVVAHAGCDFYSHVIDWREYRSLMQSFFEADVIDIELLYDNAMYAVNYNLALKYNIGWILNGINQATEGMRLPQDWTWFKFDSRNIKNIVKKNGGYKISTFPLMSIWKALYCKYVKRIKFVPILDYIEFNKKEALQDLISIGYKPYPYKHYESVFTRFYQGYILPLKFGVDKRRVHLSTLVVNGQMTKAEAQELMTGSPYPSETDLDLDRRFFLKKMGWLESDLNDYLERGTVPHDYYANDYKLWNKLIRFRRAALKFFRLQ